jgi:hypothetical protein
MQPRISRLHYFFAADFTGVPTTSTRIPLKSWWQKTYGVEMYLFFMARISCAIWNFTINDS